MDYAEGGDLCALIETHKRKNIYISEQRIWKIFTQLVKGMQVIHKMNILHRDLKSANIFLSKEGNVKIGDFNVAKLAQKGLLATQTGTPYYMSPEIWMEKPYNLKSDIWSLGILLYEMCALHMPFQATSVHSLYLKIIEGKISSIPKFYSKDLELIIRSCLNQDPKKRPSTNKLIMMIPKSQGPGLTRCVTQVLKETIKLNTDCSIIEKFLPKPNYFNCLKEVRSARRIQINAFRGNKSQQDIRDLSHQLVSERAFSRNESPFPMKPVKHIIKKAHKFSNASDILINENVCTPLIENAWNKQCSAKRLKIYLNCIPSMLKADGESRSKRLDNQSSTPVNRPLPPLNIGILSSRNDNKYVENFLTPLLKLKRNIKLIRGECT